MDPLTYHLENITLSNLDGGSVVTKLDEALEKLVKDIFDPQKNPSVQRSVSIKITLKSDHARQKMDVFTDEPNLSLAKNPPSRIEVNLEKDTDGNVYAAENKIVPQEQPEIPFKTKDKKPLHAVH